MTKVATTFFVLNSTRKLIIRFPIAFPFRKKMERENKQIKGIFLIKSISLRCQIIWIIPVTQERRTSHDWWPEAQLFKALDCTQTFNSFWWMIFPKLLNEVTISFLARTWSEAAILPRPSLYSDLLRQVLCSWFDWWETDQSKGSSIVWLLYVHRPFGVG